MFLVKNIKIAATVS